VGQSKQDRKRRRRTAVVGFLKTVPGMLAALATILTAVAGIAATLAQLGVVEVRSPIVVGPTTTTVAIAQPATTTPPTTGGDGLGEPTTSGPPVVQVDGGGGVATYLADLDATQSYHQAESAAANIDGTSYLHSLRFDACCAPATADYDLGRHYWRLEATLGVADEAPGEAVSTVEVFLDGRKAYTATVRLGRPTTLRLDVTGVLRLHMIMTSSGGQYVVAWGEARAVGLPGEVPATTGPTG
jgi:hypothetical protein